MVVGHDRLFSLLSLVPSDPLIRVSKISFLFLHREFLLVTQALPCLSSNRRDFDGAGWAAMERAGELDEMEEGIEGGRSGKGNREVDGWDRPRGC